MIGVYLLYREGERDRPYVGASKDCAHRRIAHLSELRCGIHPYQEYFQDANLVFEVVEICDISSLRSLELRVMKRFPDRINRSKSVTNSGLEFSNESKAKMSESARKKPAVTESTRKKMSSSAKSSGYQKGHSVSAEVRAKMKASALKRWEK